jgi:photosystem II stability/assembly factor-like uncharacterized protein
MRFHRHDGCARLGAAAAIFVFLGCGDGHEMDMSSPTPSPAVTASPAPTALSEVLLAVGERFGAERPPPIGGRESEQIVLRNVGDGWVQAPGDLPDDRILLGVVFSAPDTSWVFGGGLFRSSDNATTWEDLSGRVPLDFRNERIVDLAFGDDGAGLLVGITGLLGPFAMRTRNGGETWEPVPASAPSVFGTYAVGLQGLDGILVRGTDGRVSVEPADRPPRAEDVVVLLGVDTFAGGDALATVGTGAWIVADGNSMPHVFFSPGFGISFVEQTLPALGRAEIRSIDIRAERTGVAGGLTLTDRFGSFLIHTPDGGSTWQRGTIVGVPPGVGIQSVVRARGSTAWAATIDLEDGLGTMFLRSDDGGATWLHVPTPFDPNSQFRDLARNTERE